MGCYWLLYVTRLFFLCNFHCIIMKNMKIHKQKKKILKLPVDSTYRRTSLIHQQSTNIQHHKNRTWKQRGYSWLTFENTEKSTKKILFRILLNILVLFKCVCVYVFCLLGFTLWMWIVCLNFAFLPSPSPIKCNRLFVDNFVSSSC